MTTKQFRGPYLWSPRHLVGGERTAPVSQRFFEANIKDIRSGNTRSNYESHYRKLQELFPDKRFSEFTFDDIRTYMEIGIRTGHGRSDQPHRRKVQWKPLTVASARTAMSSLWTWAFKAGLCQHDVGAAIKSEYALRGAEARREAVWLETWEQAELIAACEGPRPRDARDSILLKLYLATGLRNFEGARLTWQHVHLRQGQIVVLGGKGDKTRTVPLPGGAAGPMALALEKWKIRYEAGIGRSVTTEPVLCWTHGRWAVGGVGREMAEVFLWGKPLSTSGIKKIVGYRGSLIGRPELRPHDLRRSYAGALEDQGKPIQRIQKLLGHSDVGTTIRYLSKNPARLAETVEDFDLGWS
jgi:site-specific recombinase XerD